MRNDEQLRRSVAHELGHIFGAPDNPSSRGAMDYDTYKKGPNIKDVYAILNQISSGEHYTRTKISYKTYKK